MSAAQQALIRRLFDEVINGGNLAVMEVLYAPNCVDRNAWGGDAPGLSTLRCALVELRTAFPDLHVTIEELRAEADTVVTRETWRGTYAVYGKPVTGTVSHIFRIQDGRIVEEWSGGWEWFGESGG